MRNSETGEFELVVGNRQLLSGFFIVVLLFAVFFAMGYILGQNSPRSAKMQAETQAPAPAGSAADNRPQPAAPPSAATPPAPAAGNAAAPGTPADSGPQPTTQPARDTQLPPETAPAAAPAPAPAPAAAPSASGMVQELPPGSYWQVRAVRQADAEIVVRTLKDKGFPALMTAGPNNLVRVLVGPYSDTQTLGRAKTDLENAGFNNPIRR